MGLQGSVYVPLHSPWTHGAGLLPHGEGDSARQPSFSSVTLDSLESFNQGEKAVLANQVDSEPLVQKEICILKEIIIFHYSS